MLGGRAPPFGYAVPAASQIYNQPSEGLTAVKSGLPPPPPLASQTSLKIKPVGIAPQDPSPCKYVVAVPPVGTYPTLLPPS